MVIDGIARTQGGGGGGGGGGEGVGGLTVYTYRRYDGTTEPLLADWVEEARSCLQAQQLRGETAANFLLSYLDGCAASRLTFGETLKPS